MIRQLRPSGLRATTYKHHEAAFEAALCQIAPRTYWRAWRLSFLPGLMSQATYWALLYATNLMLEAGKAVVDAYPRDQRIQQIFDLSTELHELALKAGQQPFRFHMARPDFLIDRDMQPRFCEINCRFPANGIMNSFQLSKAGSENYGVRVPFALDAEMMLGPDDGLLALVQVSEIGDEIWDLVAGRPLITVHPGGLSEVNGKIYSGRHPISKIITELDRCELLQFAPEVCNQLVGNSTLLNDMRGQLLIHDKRLLAVLWDEQLMCELMEATRYRQLKPHLIPSYRADDDAIRAALFESPQHWILKPASGGRGRGTLVGQVTHPEVWRRAIDHGRSFVAQKFIEQPQFEIICGIENKDFLRRSMTVVGCVPTLFGKALGAGLLRASNELLVNVSDGRAIMFGCCLEA